MLYFECKEYIMKRANQEQSWDSAGTKGGLTMWNGEAKLPVLGIRMEDSGVAKKKKCLEATQDIFFYKERG